MYGRLKDTRVSRLFSGEQVRVDFDLNFQAEYCNFNALALMIQHGHKHTAEIA